MRSAFKRYKLLKFANGEEKMPEEGDARDWWIEKSAVLYDLILESPNTLPMVIVLEKELAALSVRPGDDVKPVLDKIKDNYARMAAAGSNVSQMQQCTKIISVLDNSWDNLIPTLNTQQDKWTPEWLRQKILQEDFRRRHTGGGAANKTAEGYGAAGGSRGRGGGRGQGRGRGFGRGRGRGDYTEGHGSSGGRGSMKPPSGERARGGAVQGSGAHGDGAHGKADPEMFLMVEDLKGSEGDVGSVGKVVMHPLTHWVIDSGALLPVIGVGNAKVMGANEGLVGLGNVPLVEGLSANLLFVRRLQKSKEVTFSPTSCRAKLGKLLLWDLEEKSSCIKDLWQQPIIPWSGKLQATATAAATTKATTEGEETAPCDGALDAVKKVQQPQQSHGEVLAGVDATATWAKASSGSGEADWEMWHERLCHVNFPMLQKLVKDGSLKGLEIKGAVKKIGSFPTCLETKFTKFPFSSSTGPAKAPLALVHMDVVGPTRAPSLSGSRYFLTIVDDHTQFIGADFEAVLKKKGIQHQLTVPYYPQQNGVAERFNQTLQEGARTLLGCAGQPDPFWVTALRQVALVKNRVLATVGDKQWVPQWLTVSRDVKFLESLYYKKWQKQQHKLPTTPLIIEADEVQRPSRQVQVTVSDEEISGVTEDGGEPEVVRAGSVAGQCDEDEIAHCYWAAVSELKTLAKALSGPDAEKWKQSVKEEYDSWLENETWELCELPPGKKAISSKLIFKHKYGPDGELTRYKSRLVAKGFQQTKGMDFDEIFAPVGKGTTLRVMLGTAANRRWRIKQMDITTAILNGIILEELFMLQPEGLDDGSGRVCRLKNAIYGLKLAPRAWYHKLEETLLAGGFKKRECDHSLFLLQEKEQFLMLLVYVDDILLFSESAAMIERVEEMLEMQFKCSKMGDVKYYLGMHVERDLDKGVLRLHQRKYCEGQAEKYGLQDGGKPATPLPSVFTVDSCVDEEVVGESDRKQFHSMRLQRGASDLSKGEMLLTCYTDASFNSVKADGTSIGGYVCLFGGDAVSWHSKKQNEVGLSSCETEYMALPHGVKEVVWLRRLLEEIGVCQREPTVIFCDNESAVKLAKNSFLHGLTKHIRPKWHWVRRLLDKEVRLEIVKNYEQAADILTKRLAEPEHWKGMKLARISVH
ncbi:unnamed protein product [Closterium sp. NIES-53]